MITTRDIARAAGVSQSTVSRALRDHPSIPLETRQRLQELAISLGYRPNPLVSALMSSQRSARATDQRQVMAYLTTDTKRGGWKAVHTYRDFHRGALERAASYGYDLEEFWLREPRMTARRMTQILYNRNIRGLLVAPLHGDLYFPGGNAGKGHLSLDWQYFSVATIGYTMMRPGVHRATHNHLLGIRTALRQLQKLGYRRIGLALHESHDARVDYNWSTGFAKHLLSQRPAGRTTPFIRPNVTFTCPEFLKWFKKERPDAVLAGQDAVHDWMQRGGIRVPEDAGFAMLDVVRDDPNPLKVAGIDQNSPAIGAAAVDLVVGQLNRNERGLPELPKITLVDCRWVDGETVRVR
jgi:LacI family transcriptional regulator